MPQLHFTAQVPCPSGPAKRGRAYYKAFTGEVNGDLIRIGVYVLMKAGGFQVSPFVAAGSDRAQNSHRKIHAGPPPSPLGLGGTFAFEKSRNSHNLCVSQRENEAF